MQDLLLEMLAEEHPLRLAVNSAHMPPLLAHTEAQIFPVNSASGALQGSARAASATPQPLGVLPMKETSLTEVMFTYWRCLWRK